MIERRVTPAQQLTEADWPALLQALRDGAVLLASSIDGWVTAPLPVTEAAVERELAFVDAMWEGGRTHGKIGAEDLALLEERRALLRRRLLRTA